MGCRLAATSLCFEKSIGVKMAKVRVFISFDFDYDSGIKALLVGQAKNEDSPFEISDWSVKEELSGDWKEKVRARIKKPYFLLWGYSDKTCKKPRAALDSDKIYKWTWDNLKSLLNGSR